MPQSSEPPTGSPEHAAALAEYRDALTARTNRQKSDQDPAEWLPPAPEAQCRYVGEWVSTKLRWQLAGDAAELEALKVFTEGPCEDSIVSYTPAP